MTVQSINEADVEEARQLFLQCCTSRRWIERMVKSRPYATALDVRGQASAHWGDLAEDDYLEAFDGHPKIGDVSSLKAKYANTKQLAAGEQSGMNVAQEEEIAKLAEGNRLYEEKFGFIFIVCATGKSAAQMSELLQARLHNDRKTELRNAAEEQRKIFQIRLNQLLDEPL
jgi:2-oxo-4-hydroxy-4-carboxy-5-ureidoimidazoline decarboxylase